MPARPRAVLHAPDALVAGTDHTVELELVADEATKIDFVEVRLRVDTGWAVGSGNHRISVHQRFTELVARPLGAGVLPAGATRLPVRLQLPADAPPTHRLGPAYVTAKLRARVSIPWWLDGRYTWPIAVRRPPARVDRTPATIRTTEAPEQPRLELGLASMRLCAGETVVGSIAVFHVDDHKPREVELAVIPTLSLFGRHRERERDGAAYTVKIELPAGSAGTSVPFGFQLPESITPSFRTDTHELSWRLVATWGSWLTTRLRGALALAILDGAAAAHAPPLTRTPRIGDARVAAMFARFAEELAWHLVGGADDDDDAADATTAEREHRGMTLRLDFAYRGEAGSFLVATVAHPSLGLGLGVQPGSGLRHVFFHDVEVGDATWDRAHHVVARAAQQAVPFLRAVVPALAADTLPGPLARWDDDALVLERSVVSVELADLHAAASALVRIADAIADARAAIAPPPELAIDLDAWRRLAAAIQADLVVGDLGLDGELDGLPVAGELRFDPTGAPLGYRATVGSPAAATAAARAIAITLATPAAQALDVGDRDRLASQLVTWPTDVTDLRIADGVASAVLAVGAPPALDAARVRDLYDRLRGALAALDPGAGPYR